MCILIACPPNETPDLEDLWEATDQNPDGHGWAIRINGTIERYVGMNADRAISTFLDARDRWPNAWAIWHSRFATQGLLDTSNCQPFLVPGNGWVMAHNGILPLSDGPLDDRRSDSRILAEDHLPQTSWQTLRHRYDEFDAWMAPSKVVVMSAHKEKGGPVVIFGEKRGIWAKDACWWSARPYVWATNLKPHATTNYLTDMDFDDEEEAEHLSRKAVDEAAWDEYETAYADLQKMDR